MMFRLIPSPTTLKLVARAYSSTAGEASVVARKAPVTIGEAPAAVDEAPVVAAPTLAPQVRHPYFVSRTANNNLPVYTDIRNGRTRHLTIIRRIEGDVDVCIKLSPRLPFRTDLQPCDCVYTLPQFPVLNTRNCVRIYWSCFLTEPVTQSPSTGRTTRLWSKGSGIMRCPCG